MSNGRVTDRDSSINYLSSPYVVILSRPRSISRRNRDVQTTKLMNVNDVVLFYRLSCREHGVVGRGSRHQEFHVRRKRRGKSGL